MNHNLTSKEIRNIFIDYFTNRGHVHVPSSSTIPSNDHSLLFANAGMNQFKDIFLGTVDTSSDKFLLKRAVNSQKCVRAGGKHNDLDDVGRDSYHHTFFEMLGNWSFGDYFKLDAIKMALDLLTNIYKLPKDRLYVTYFQGESNLGLKADYETQKIWLDMGIPESRILPFGAKENFWEMGETGPCGPCSEIHYDRIGNRDATKLVNQDHPEVLEIWNLVFIQFDRQLDGQLKNLPKKHVDTGMGFERIVSVIQNKTSNYETDLFQPIFKAIQEHAFCAPYQGKIGIDDKDHIDTAYRVVSDHIRTLAITLADGGRPDRSGQGYVLKRILRRAVRFSNEIFQCSDGFLSSLIDVVITTIGDQFPEILKERDIIQAIINAEERQFLQTLKRGEKLFKKESDILLSNNSNTISGYLAWKLYNTYGFPIDLTSILAEERGMKVDLVGYDNAKQLSLIADQGKVTLSLDTISLDIHGIDILNSKSIPQTVDEMKYNYTIDKLGNYIMSPCTATVLAILKSNNQFAENAKDVLVGLILDQTNFYAESGGQLTDFGFIASTKGSELIVENVQVKAGYVLHIGNLVGDFYVGEIVTLIVDEERRRNLMNNHTGTHILNFALRSVIGIADQRGSLIAPEKLRFDFSSDLPLTIDQIKNVENICNDDLIYHSYPIYNSMVELAKAKEINGLRAIFGDTYPNLVRVISIGIPVEQLLIDTSGPVALLYSVELCGGTHLFNSKDLKYLTIISEDSISAGVRRIEAVTGDEALNTLRESISCKSIVENELHRIQKGVKSNSISIKASVRNLSHIDENISSKKIPYLSKINIRNSIKILKKEIDEIDKAEKNALNQLSLDEAKAHVKNIDKNSKFIVHIIPAGSAFKALEISMKYFVSNFETCAFLLFSIDPKENNVICYSQVPKIIASRGLSAKNWVLSILDLISGKGGGSEFTAQATGSNSSQINDAIATANAYARKFFT